MRFYHIAVYLFMITPIYNNYSYSMIISITGMLR